MKDLFRIFVFFICNIMYSQTSLNQLELGDKNIITVSNEREFLNALSSCKGDCNIYVKEFSKIDLSYYKNIKVSSNTRIFSNRGIGDGQGAHIFCNNDGVHPLFDVAGKNVIFFGLIIEGNDGNMLVGEDAFSGKSDEFKKKNWDSLTKKNMYATPVSSGIAITGDNILIENCELKNWTYTAIYVRSKSKNVVVRNNFIHHNQRYGLGYGVTVDNGEVLVEGNVFDYNRHSIASTGRENSVYIVRNNIFKQNGNYSWAVDMHGGIDRKDNTNVAGKYALIENNIFYVTNKGRAVVFRGIPIQKVLISNNIVYMLSNSKLLKSQMFEQINSFGNFYLDNNIVYE